MGFFSQMAIIVAVCIIHILIYGLMTLIRGFSRQALKEIKLTSDFVGVLVAWVAVLVISFLIGLLNSYLQRKNTFKNLMDQEEKDLIINFRKSKKLQKSKQQQQSAQQQQQQQSAKPVQQQILLQHGDGGDGPGGGVPAGAKKKHKKKKKNNPLIGAEGGADVNPFLQQQINQPGQ